MLRNMLVCLTAVGFSLVHFGCAAKPEPKPEVKQPVSVAPMSKPMRTRAPKPLTQDEEAKIARAAAGAGGAGSGGGAGGNGSVGSGAEAGAGGASGALGQGAVVAGSSVDATDANNAKIESAWGADGVDGAKGIVYPVAPKVSGISSDMIDALKLADTDPRRKFVGVWEQSGGSSSADFAHGGYRQTLLVFRTDGVLDVIRLYGEKSETRVDFRLMYEVGADGSLKLSADPKLSGASRSGRLKLPAGKGQPPIIAEAPALKLPATLSPSVSEQDMTLEGKTYRRRKTE